MRIRHTARVGGGLLALVLAVIVASPTAFAREDGSRRFLVTVQNLTHGQPFSPPVAATHRHGRHMFQVGQLATDQLAAIAQDGDEHPMFALFDGADGVTQAMDVGRPLTPHGRVVGTFTDSVSFEIAGRPRDRFSLAAMLICTNDGFLGLDAVGLPAEGRHTFFLNGYDAGRENNTEKQQDVVEPCSVLGPTVLPGVHPSPNRDAEVATVPPEVIHLHPGITGIGDLVRAEHGWTNPVAKVTITRIDEDDD